MYLYIFIITKIVGNWLISFTQSQIIKMDLNIDFKRGWHFGDQIKLSSLNQHKCQALFQHAG